MKRNSILRALVGIFVFAISQTTLAQQTNTFPDSGFVGIGILTPSSNLQVVGTTKLGSKPNNASIDNKGNLVFNGTAAYKVGPDRYVFRYSADTDYGMFFSAANLRYELRNNAAAPTFFAGADNGNGYFAGNLGLGVQAATAKLDVAGTVKIADGTQGAGKVLTSNASGLASWQTPTAGVTGGAAGRVAFWTGATTLSNTKYLSWDNINVRLGIGVGDSPHAQLHLGNALANRKIILREEANNENQFNGLGTNTNIFRYQVSSTAADHVFFAGTSTTTSNELLRIKGNGNVGIGTATPNAPLQFKNSVANRKIVLYEDANNDNQFWGFGVNSGVVRYQVSTTQGDHVFYAGNSTTTSVELMRIKGNGNVAIGANPSSGYKLTVGGKIICTELKVQLQPFPDYVFDKNYRLRSINEVEDYIKTNKRLPNMPPAAEVEKNGMSVGEIQGKLVEKVEELTLYIIQQQKQIEELQKQILALKK